MAFQTFIDKETSMEMQNVAVLRRVLRGQPELPSRRLPDPGSLGQRYYFLVWHCGGPMLRYKDVTPVLGTAEETVRRIAVCPTCFAEQRIFP